MGPDAARQQAGLVVGELQAPGGSPLPRSLLARLRAPAPVAVVTFGAFDAYRYDGLRIDGFDQPLTVYAIPGRDHPTVVACYAAPGAGQEVDLLDLAEHRARLAGVFGLAVLGVIHRLPEAALRGFFVDLGATDVVAATHYINGGFLATHQLAHDFVDQAFFNQGLDSFWCFHIDCRIGVDFCCEASPVRR